MRLYEIYHLIESFPIAKKTFIDQGGNPNEVNQYIEKYRDLVKRNVIDKEDAKDIVAWTKLGWDEFKRHIDDWKDVPSDSELKKVSKPASDEQIYLGENEDWLVVIPTSHKASCFHGRKSSWCTTKPMQSYYSQYVLNKNVTLIYVINKDPSKQDAGGMYAIEYHNDTDEIELFDKNNNTLGEQDFKTYTGLNPRDLINLAKKHDPSIQSGRERTKQVDPVYLANRAIATGERNQPAEKYIMRHPIAFNYAVKFFPGKRWKQAEPAIARNAKTAFDYAFHIIKDRWPKAEPVIMKDPEIAYRYAAQIINYNNFEVDEMERWPEAEPYIMKDPQSARTYARDVIKGRWPEAEPVILNDEDPWIAISYAEDVIKGPWPEAGIDELD